MDKLHLIVPCHFGVESVLKREIIDLGYEIERVEDGRITFREIYWQYAGANVFLRTAERVMIQVGRVKAQTYDDELFEAVKALKWSDFINGKRKILGKKASSVKSKLFNPQITKNSKKGNCGEFRNRTYGVSWFSEDGASYPIRVFFYKDEAVIALDIRSISQKEDTQILYLKGTYFRNIGGSTDYYPWNKDRICGSFCGCGTFPIEAAT